MEDENLDLKGGVLIIGSLLWQNDLDIEEKDNKRKLWRDKHLLLDRKIMVKVPIRYGRISSSNIYTMTFSNSCKNTKQGTGFFVPFRTNSLSSFENLMHIVKLTSKAEGMKGKLLAKNSRTQEIWCSMGLLLNPKTIGIEKANFLITKWSREIAKEGSINTSLFKLGREKPCINKAGKLNIDWISSVDKRDAEILNNYDFAIATATKPTKYPNIKELTEKIIADKSRYYFIGNYKSGITTFQDIQILNKM